MRRPSLRLIFGMFAGRRHPLCQFAVRTIGTVPVAALKESYTSRPPAGNRDKMSYLMEALS